MRREVQSRPGVVAIARTYSRIREFARTGRPSYPDGQGRTDAPDTANTSKGS